MDLQKFLEKERQQAEETKARSNMFWANLTEFAKDELGDVNEKKWGQVQEDDACKSKS